MAGAPPFQADWAANVVLSPARNEPHPFLEDAGWQGSALQLQCGDYGSARIHLRLFRQGAYTLGAAHFDVLISGTTSHEALSWEFPRDFVTFDLARSGLVVANPKATLSITPAPYYRTIRWQVFNGVPVTLRGALDLPLADQSSDVDIPNDGVATVLTLGGELDPVSSDSIVEFDHPFDRIIPKPFCATAPWDLLEVEGKIHMVHRVRTNPSGKYTARFMASGVLQVTPIDGRTGQPVGETHTAHVSEMHRSGLTDRRQAASLTAMQVLLADPAQSLLEKLWAGSVSRYVRKERCGS